MALLAWLAVLAPAASASGDQTSFMMDDDQLLYHGDRARGRALVQMQSLGVDAVRVTVLWRVVARGVNPRSERFDADDPRTYPRQNWDRYDGLVRDAARLGINVLFNITGPGPDWGHRTPPRAQRRNRLTYKPYAGRFGAFVRAVGKRYTGRYRDENATRQLLPRVRLWSIWNEPNQAGWLTPQWERRDGQLVAASPQLYRDLYTAGHRALVGSGHGRDTILLGETAPSGSSRRTSRSPMRPAAFLRELLCADRRSRPLRGSAARRRGCGDFQRRGPLRATGFAHHPYTKDRAPTSRPRHRDDLTLANLDALTGLLDGLAAGTKGRIPDRLPLVLTEFGFETNPPDRFHGVSVQRQARYLQLAEFVTHQHPRVAGMTQFLLRDVPPVRSHSSGSKAYWATYQSGLFDRRGVPKQAAFAYAMPFVAFPGGQGAVGLWGQVRYRPNRPGEQVQLQWQGRPGGSWANVGPPVVTDARGYFDVRRSRPGTGGVYRAVHLNAGTGQGDLASLPDAG